MKRQILLGQLASQAWAMDPEHLANLSSVLHRWSAGESASDDVMADVRVAQATRTARKQTASNVGGGIAVLPLYGVITQRASMVNEISGAGGTSTQKFTQAFREAMGDTSIAGILIDCDSPGGSVNGTPELAAEVMKARGVKPVYGYVNSLAASACYWIASACEAIYSTSSGSAGSIGVYCAHTDASEAMKKAGLSQELISAGKYKTEGSSNGPLSPEARAFIQSQIDSFYRAFTNDVARGRGVAPAAVRSGFGQGRCLLADEAQKAGLIDGICTFDEAVAKLATRARDRSPAAARVAQIPAGATGATQGLLATGSGKGDWRVRAEARKRQLEILERM